VGTIANHFIYLGINLARMEVPSAMMGTQKPPNDQADFVTALLPRTLIRALDRYIAEEAPGKTRSDVLRLAFKEWCINRGFVQPNEIDPELS
jgi:hypothetical protein